MEQTGGGFVKLQQPPGQMFTHVSLASGRIVRPDERGCIVCAPGDAGALMGAGWAVVTPLPPRAA